MKQVFDSNSVRPNRDLFEKLCALKLSALGLNVDNLSFLKHFFSILPFGWRYSHAWHSSLTYFRNGLSPGLVWSLPPTWFSERPLSLENSAIIWSLNVVPWLFPIIYSNTIFLSDDQGCPGRVWSDTSLLLSSLLIKITAGPQIWKLCSDDKWEVSSGVKLKRKVLSLTLFSGVGRPPGWMNVFSSESRRGCFESVVSSDVMCGWKVWRCYSRQFHHRPLNIQPVWGREILNYFGFDDV